jgi:hypothetical protein
MIKCFPRRQIRKRHCNVRNGHNNRTNLQKTLAAAQNPFELYFSLNCKRVKIWIRDCAIRESSIIFRIRPHFISRQCNSFRGAKSKGAFSLSLTRHSGDSQTICPGFILERMNNVRGHSSPHLVHLSDQYAIPAPLSC